MTDYNATKKTICVDLDGTILSYDGYKGPDIFGEPLPGARRAMEMLKEYGFEIIIHTCRRETDLISAALKKYDIPFDSINMNRAHPNDVPGKPWANHYVDDRAIEFKGDWQEILTRLIFRSSDED